MKMIRKLTFIILAALLLAPQSVASAGKTQTLLGI